jgi:hypothetical protein
MWPIPGHPALDLNWKVQALIKHQRKMQVQFYQFYQYFTKIKDGRQIVVVQLCPICQLKVENPLPCLDRWYSKSE